MPNIDNVLFDVGPGMQINSSRIIAIMRNKGARAKRLRRVYMEGDKFLNATSFSASEELDRRSIKTLVITDTDWMIGTSYTIKVVSNKYHRGLLTAITLRQDLAELVAEILQKGDPSHGKEEIPQGRQRRRPKAKRGLRPDEILDA